MDFSQVNVHMRECGLIDISANTSLADEALNMDIRYLDNVNDSMLTKYIAALSQYSMYITLLYNKYMVVKTRLSKALDVRVYIFCKNNKLKGTKAEKKMEACLQSDAINRLKSELDNVKERLLLLQDTAKYIDSYVNALKKDLSRRRIEFGGYNR
jgi:hypothetical protein